MTTPPPTTATAAAEPAGPPATDRPAEPGGAGGDPAAPAPAGSAPVGKAAELMAAVRAVESGERSAADFFAAPAPPPPARRPAAAAPAAASGTGPVEVPAEVHGVLARGGAPESLAEPVVRALGPDAAALLAADPWQLLAVAAVQPEQADGFARTLLGEDGDPDDPRRTAALIVRLLDRAALRGHTVLAAATVAEQLGGHGVRDTGAALSAAVDEGVVLAFEEPPGESGAASGPGRPAPAEEPEAEPAEEQRPVLLGLERWALAEEGLAEGVQRLLTTFRTTPPRAGAPGPAAPPAEEPSTDDPTAGTASDGTAAAGAAADAPVAVPPAVVVPTEEEWAAAAGAAGSPSAAELIRACAGAGLVLHTGGEAARAEPAALLAAAARLGLRGCAAAHTDYGRARLTQLLAEATTASDAAAPPAVVTVAGLLAGTEGPARDEEGCFALDLLVVTDAAQLDTESAAALVESLPEGARLVLSGDPQLLGPAGAGQVLADLLAAGVAPVLASRTPDPGLLGELVSAVGIGELPAVQAPDKELVIVPVQDAGEAVHRTVQLVGDSVPRAVGVPSEETQVVTVGHGGAAGTRALNAALKERFNPGPGAFGGFDPGDRVVYAPAPGRSLAGRVVGADAAGLRLEGRDGPVTVARERVGATVRHGWAVSAHQAAGLRWPAVVVVLPGDAGPALDRRWVYTAFGRGERHVSVVHGAGQELNRAVQERPGPSRTTRLRTLLAPRPAPPVADPAAE